MVSYHEMFYGQLPTVPLYIYIYIYTLETSLFNHMSNRINAGKKYDKII